MSNALKLEAIFIRECPAAPESIKTKISEMSGSAGIN